MDWQRMRFKGQLVWVRVDAEGRPVVDEEGRAEMKYRPEEERIYRPSPRNLEPAPGPSAATAKKPPPEPRPLPSRAGPALPPAPARPLLAPEGETIHVWTDGACTGNPGPMGIGVVVIAPGQRRELGQYLGQGTNNIAELTAIERGLTLAEELAPDRQRPVRIYSDSAYAIGLLSRGWKAKANQELVARLRRRTSTFPHLTFVKVAGHAGVPENERCDELARRAIELRADV
jgi:ribonuclease HI